MYLSLPKFNIIFPNCFQYNLDTEKIHRKTFIKIAKEYGKEFPDDLRIKILGIQEMECATLIVNTLKLNITPQALLEKSRVMEEKEMSNVKFINGEFIL